MKKRTIHTILFLMLLAALSCTGLNAQDTLGDTSRLRIRVFEPKSYSDSDSTYDEPKIVELTKLQIGARQSAKTHLGYDKPYSRKGLIEELEYEGYVYIDAATAVDDLNVNWGNQAKNMAKNYLRLDAFSKKALIQQLEDEGFDHEDAVYGVKNCGANWMAQAKRMASDFTHINGTTRDEVIQQLEDRGFTHDQAVYGANQNGFKSEKSLVNKIKEKFSKSDSDD